MIFSPTAKHAIRALIYLAVHDGLGPTLGKDIAASETIPKPFLSKILHDLRIKGLVKTTKGPGGGYELAKSAKDMTVREVVEAVDGPLDLSSTCILGLDECSDEVSCALHEPWKKFRSEFESTIADLTLSEAASTMEHKKRQSGR